MISLSASLAAHQRGSNRKPALTLTARASRGGMPLFPWTRVYSGSEHDAPHAAALTPAGTLIRARNDSGALHIQRVANPSASSDFSAWTHVDSGLLPGGGIALAARAGEVLVLYTTGTALVRRSSTDDGATWSSATTILTESSNIGSIAVAFNAAGDACAFYTIGTSTTLKRVRRTSGTWASSGTTWTRAGNAASLTGLAAVSNGDFQLLITGTAATTGHRRAWGAVMGDLDLPANAWSTLAEIATADASSGTTFAAPSLALAGLTLRATFAQAESGNVAVTRAMELASPGDLANGPWTEPAPHEAPSANGLALAIGADVAWASTPSGVWRAELAANADLSARLVSARYRITPRSARCTIELDDAAGDGVPAALRAGGTVDLRTGYQTSAGDEYGHLLTFAVDRIVRAAAGGRRVVRIEASGAWEELGRFRWPQAWQTAAGELLRSQIAARIAARAGLAVNNSSPSADWLGYKPSFVIAQGESGATALARLLDVVSDGVRTGEEDGLTVVGLAEDDAPTYAYGGAGEHPIAAFELVDEPPGANWIRVQGPDRYADELDFASIYAHGPALRTVRNLDATTDTKATSWAENALRRAEWSTATATLTAPAQVGQQLFDVVTVSVPALGIEGQDYRVIGIALEYKRGPAGARYDTTLELGQL